METVNRAGILKSMCHVTKRTKVTKGFEPPCFVLIVTFVTQDRILKKGGAGTCSPASALERERLSRDFGGPKKAMVRFVRP